MKKREILAVLIIISILFLSFEASYAWVLHEDSYPRYTIEGKGIIENVEFCIIKKGQFVCRSMGDFENEELGINCSYSLYGQENSYADNANIGELDFNCIVEKKHDTVCPISMKLGDWPKRRITDKDEKEIVVEKIQSDVVGIVGEGRGIVFIKPEGYHFRLKELSSGITFRLCSNDAPPGQYDTSLIFVPISSEISKDQLHEPIIDVENPPDTLEIVPENGEKENSGDVTKPEGGKGLGNYIRQYGMWAFVIILFITFLIVILSSFHHMVKKNDKEAEKDTDDDKVEEELFHH